MSPSNPLGELKNPGLEALLESARGESQREIRLALTGRSDEAWGSGWKSEGHGIYIEYLEPSFAPLSALYTRPLMRQVRNGGAVGTMLVGCIIMHLPTTNNKPGRQATTFEASRRAEWA